MKKLSTIIISLILVLSLTGEIFAAPGNFFKKENAGEISIGLSEDMTEVPGDETAEAVLSGDENDIVSADADDTAADTDADIILKDSEDEEENLVENAVDDSVESEEVAGVIDLDLMQEGGLPSESVDVSGLVSQEGVSFEEYVESAIENRDEIVDLSEFEMQPEEAARAMAEVINSNPRYFFLSGEDVPVTFDASTGIVSEVGLIYTMDEGEISSRQKVIDDELANILAFVEAAPDGELDKVLAIHEYFCLNYSYDYKCVLSSVDDLMLYKQGLCQAFALAFELVCDELEITNGFAAGYPEPEIKEESDDEDPEKEDPDDEEDEILIGHAWNSVLVDGEWYMIDTTWDGQSDRAGFVSRKYLLKSMSEFGHEKYSYDYTYNGGEAVSTAYDRAWWHEDTQMNTGLYPLDGNWYYLNDNKIMTKASAYPDAEAKTVFAGNDLISVGTAICVYGGRIWFSGTGLGSSAVRNIYSMEPDGTGLVLEYTETDHETIYGLGGLYGCLYYTVKVNDNEYCNKPVAPADGLEIFTEDLQILPSELTMTEDTAQLTAVIYPENATESAVYWTSSDNSVVQVDDNGLLTAVGCGTAVITAAVGNGSHRATACITVPKAGEIGYYKVFISEISETEGKMFWTPAENASVYYVYRSIDDRYQLTDYSCNKYELIGVTDENEIDIERDDPEEEYCYTVVAANENGRVSAYYVTKKNKGEELRTIIFDPTVTWLPGNNAVSDLSITQGTAGFRVGEIHPTGTNRADISFTGTENADYYKIYRLNLDGNGNLLPLQNIGDIIVVHNLNCSYKGFSLNPETGALFFVEAYKKEVTENEGTRDIRISNMSEPVELIPEGIWFYDVSQKLDVGQEYQASVQYLPDGTEAEAEDFIWKSGNKDVLTVADDGTMTGISEGKANLYVYTKDKAYGAMCSVEVSNVSAESITLNKTKLTLVVDTAKKLKATVLPVNTTNKNVIWTSSNPTVAKVSSNGKVTAKKAGTATIKAKTEDGPFEAKCVVTVTQPVEGIKLRLKKPDLTLKKGKTYNLKVTILPADATNKKVKWTSSDTSVVTVSASGNLKAKKPGTATIIVKTVDGGYKAKCSVTVTAK